MRQNLLFPFLGAFLFPVVADIRPAWLISSFMATERSFAGCHFVGITREPGAFQAAALQSSVPGCSGGHDFCKNRSPFAESVSLLFWVSFLGTQHRVYSL
jgi:hypothetical protein